MKKYYSSAIQLLKQLASDYMLMAAFLVPFIVGMIIRLAIPACIPQKNQRNFIKQFSNIHIGIKPTD